MGGAGGAQTREVRTVEGARGWRRTAASGLPVALPVAMKAVFDLSTRRYGPRRGYQLGFAIYWASCWGLAAAVVERDALRDLWRMPAQAFPRPRTLSAAALLVPPAGAVATQWLPHARAAGPAAVAAAVAVGSTNAMAEEVFWRGMPVAEFPDEPVRGWLWPAFGFTVWHLVPLTTRPSSLRRQASLLAGAAVIGIGYGWVAYASRSLVLTATAHAVTDSSGVRPVASAWLTARG